MSEYLSILGRLALLIAAAAVIGYSVAELIT